MKDRQALGTKGVTCPGKSWKNKNKFYLRQYFSSKSKSQLEMPSHLFLCFMQPPPGEHWYWFALQAENTQHYYHIWIYNIIEQV